MPIALTPDGLQIQTYDQLVKSVGADIQSQIAASIDVTTGSGLGQLARILCERFADLYQLGQTCYSSMDPDAATGAALDNVCALVGVYRLAASASFVTATLTGTPTTVVPAGSQAQTLSTKINFALPADATITALTAWAPTTLYVIGDRVTNVGRCYQATVGGTSAGSGGPTTTGSAITDGGVTWEYLGQGTGAVDARMNAVLTGALIAVAGDLTKIFSPIAGWSSVTNLDDATPGSDAMTDEDLRILRDAELAAPGTSPQNAIRADILKLPGVSSCTVFVNDAETVDGFGQAPHSVQCLVVGGADQDIYNQLLNSVAAGIATDSTAADFAHGQRIGTATDDEGNTFTEKFTRPEAVPIYCFVELSFFASSYPPDGDNEVKLAIVAFADANIIGGLNANASQINAQAFKVPGVYTSRTWIYTDVINPPVAWAPTTAYVATPGARSVVSNDDGRLYICTTGGTSAGSGGPTGTGSAIADGGAVWQFLGSPITVTRLQNAQFDTSRIRVVSTPGFD